MVAKELWLQGDLRGTGGEAIQDSWRAQLHRQIECWVLKNVYLRVQGVNQYEDVHVTVANLVIIRDLLQCESDIFQTLTSSWPKNSAIVKISGINFC